MSGLDVVLQQVVNGLALGMMYALLALGFTMALVLRPPPEQPEAPATETTK